MTTTPPQETAPPTGAPQQTAPQRTSLQRTAAEPVAPEQTAPHTAVPRRPAPRGYLTPECRIGRTDPDFRHGCPSCRAPGYQHPVLGYTPVPCGCTCHPDGARP